MTYGFQVFNDNQDVVLDASSSAWNLIDLFDVAFSSGNTGSKTYTNIGANQEIVARVEPYDKLTADGRDGGALFASISGNTVNWEWSKMYVSGRFTVDPYIIMFLLDGVYTPANPYAGHWANSIQVLNYGYSEARISVFSK